MITPVILQSLLLLLLCKELDTSLYKHPVKKFFLLRGKGENLTCESIENPENMEYPGYYCKLRQKIQKMWEDYYHCIEVQAEKTLQPEIHHLVEGQFAEFACPICKKPFQDYEELQWKYKVLSSELSTTDPEDLDLTPRMELTSDKTLKIFNLVEDASGMYICYQGQSIVSIYILEVSKTDVIEEIQTPNTRHLAVVDFESVEFQTYYKWTPWTECSLCGNIGRKYKYGMCVVTNKKKIHFYSNFTDDTTENSQNRIRKDVNMSKNVFNFLNKFKFGVGGSGNQQFPIEKEKVNWLIEVIQKTKNGVPCFWSYLTQMGFKSIQQRPAVKAVVKHCLVDCPEYEIFQVVDNMGNVIETANNSAGIYSAFQKIPQPPPDIEHASLTANFGTAITIQCPSTLRKNIPVTWKINKKIIFPNKIANESSGRFTVDLLNRLHINKIRQRDDRIYSCWQRDQLVGTVRLNVEKRLKVVFDHHTTLFVLVTLVGVLVLLGSKIISWELNKEKN